MSDPRVFKLADHVLSQWGKHGVAGSTPDVATAWAFSVLTTAEDAGLTIFALDMVDTRPLIEAARDAFRAAVASPTPGAAWSDAVRAVLASLAAAVDRPTKAELDSDEMDRSWPRGNYSDGGV